jgi:hypothetical protein
MYPDEPSALAPGDEAARLIQEELDPIVPPAGEREALLRRILERTGGEPPIAPAPAPALTPAPTPTPTPTPKAS